MASLRTSRGIANGRSAQRKTAAIFARTRLAIGLAAVGFCATLPAADLVEVYQLGVASDPALLAARYQYQSTAEVEKQAFARFLPQLNASASLTKGDSQFLIDGTLVNENDLDTENINIQLQQTIYDHANYKRLDQARAQVAAAESDYEAAVQAFLLRAAERYFEVLTAEQNLRSVRAEEEAVGRQLEQAEQRYEVGLTAITDVHEAKAQYDNTRARAIVSENSLNDAREALAELTGEYIGQLDPLKDEIPLELPEPNRLEDWVDRGLRSNPLLRSREMSAEAAHQRVRLERAGHYPTLSLVAQHNENTNNEFLILDDFQQVRDTVSSLAEQNTIRLQLDVPIYAGGSVNSLTRQAAADYEAALQQLEEQRRSVLRNTRNAYRGTEASVLEVEARQQALISAESALEATEAGFEVGTRTIVDVLIAQQNLYQAQRDYAQARHDYLLNTLRLKSAAGTLEASDIQQVNALLQ